MASPPETGDRPVDPRPLRGWAVLVVFGVACAFRLGYYLELSGAGALEHLAMDAVYNVEWAKGLATGVWAEEYASLDGAVFFRAPLYSYTLAGIFKLTGVDLPLVRLLQLLVGASSCVWILALGTKLHGQRVGLVAGLLAAANWVLITFDATFLLPVALIFWLSLGLLLLLVGAERRSVWIAGAGGLALGLFTITRPNLLVFLPFVVLWALCVARVASVDPRRTESEAPEALGPTASRKTLLFPLLVALGSFLPPAAVTLRNWMVADDWVPVASQGGVNFYIGNNAASNGWTAVVPGTSTTLLGGIRDTVLLAETDAGRELRPSEVSSYWFGRAFDEIAEDPGRWFGLLGRKALGLVTDVEIPNNEPYEARRADYESLRLVPIGFGLLFAGWVATLLDLRRRNRDRVRASFEWLLVGFVLVYGATLVGFFVNGRFRVPLLPVLTVGAALTLCRLAAALRARDLRPLATTGVLFVSLTAILRIDFLDVRANTRGWTDYTLALEALDAKDVALASRRFAEIEERGTFVRLDYFKRYTALCQKSGDLERGIAVAERGVGHFPRDPSLLLFLAAAETQRGNWERVATWSRRYLEAGPRDEMPGRFYAFLAALEQGDRDGARAQLREAEEVAPAHELLQDMRRRLGER